MSKIIAVNHYYKKEKGTYTYKIIEFARHFKTGELTLVFMRVTRSGVPIKEKIFVLALDDFAKSELDHIGDSLEKK